MIDKRVLLGAVAVLMAGVVVAAPAGADPDPVAAAPATIPDFNGDGLPDLAIGAPFATVRGVEFAGAIGIVYGKATGLNPANVKAINRAMAVVPGVPEFLDLFGATLRSGDFDGDGFADLAVATNEPHPPVYLLFGGTTGFTRAITAYPTDGAMIEEFGRTMAVADFNKDGIADLYAAGAADTRPGFVLYGKAGLQHAQAKFVKLTSHTLALDRVGAAAGDITGDGYADLVVTRVRGTQSDVVLHKGGPSGLSTTPSQRVAGGGRVAAVGDVDKDGFADVAIGFADTTVASKPDAGHVRVWYGSAAGLNTVRGSLVLHQETPRIPDVAEAKDVFGSDVALGDINGDGRADLAIGVLGESYGAKFGAGQVTVIFGGAGGIVPATAKIQSFSQDSPGVGEVLEAGDAFGWATSLRDYNRDGRADLVVGAVDDNNGEGVVHVLNGTASGLTGTGSLLFGPANLAMGHGFARVGSGSDR